MFGLEIDPIRGLKHENEFARIHLPGPDGLLGWASAADRLVDRILQREPLSASFRLNDLYAFAATTAAAATACMITCGLKQVSAFIFREHIKRYMDEKEEEVGMCLLALARLTVF